jgi:hypothetical protein
MTNSLTNQKPSAIYRLRPHLPPDAPLPISTSSPTQAANLGIEIAPLPQLEQLLSTIGGGAEGKGKEVAGKVDVGKVAEKVVKNVRLSFTILLSFSLPILSDVLVVLVLALRGIEADDSCSITYILSEEMSSSRKSVPARTRCPRVENNVG